MRPDQARYQIQQVGFKTYQIKLGQTWAGKSKRDQISNHADNKQKLYEFRHEQTTADYSIPRCSGTFIFRCFLKAKRKRNSQFSVIRGEMMQPLSWSGKELHRMQNVIDADLCLIHPSIIQTSNYSSVRLSIIHSDIHNTNTVRFQTRLK